MKATDAWALNGRDLEENFVSGNIGRLYMWEFIVDPSINLWGLVSKTIDDEAQLESALHMDHTLSKH